MKKKLKSFIQIKFDSNKTYSNLLKRKEKN